MATIIIEDDESFNSPTILYSDGAMNKTTGEYAWGSVVDQDGGDVLHLYRDIIYDMNIKEKTLPRGIGDRLVIVTKFNDVKTQQHNGAELLALVVALRIAKECSSVHTIKCDSAVVLSWVTKGPLPVTRKKMDPLKLKYIEEGIKLRQEFILRGGVVEKISGDDNLADLGYH